MTLSSQDINSIVAALQDSDWDEASVVIGDVKIAVARNGARLPVDSGQVASAPAQIIAAAPAAPTTPETPTAVAPVAVPAPSHISTDVVIEAPSVGVFWRAPEPGAAPYVEVGSRIEAGDTVAIVEIMKLMSNVASEVAGVVTAIHVDNGAPVQHGDSLISIRPDSA